MLVKNLLFSIASLIVFNLHIVAHVFGFLYIYLLKQYKYQLDVCSGIYITSFAWK